MSVLPDRSAEGTPEPIRRTAAGAGSAPLRPLRPACDARPVKRVPRWLAAFRGPTPVRAGADADGLWVARQVRGEPVTDRLRWDEVDGAVAFKRDLVATDLVCVAFEAGGRVLEVDEEMEGWPEVLARAAERLPGFPPRADLEGAVRLPPFEECRTVLFRRAAPGS